MSENVTPNKSPKLRAYHTELAANTLARAYAEEIVACVKAIVEPDDGMTVSCLNCLHFVERTEICSKFNARPPARVIAFGCSAYDDQGDIPF